MNTNTLPASGTLTQPRQRIKRSSRKHWHNGTWVYTPTYYSWHSMKNRCLRPEVDQYPRYGGRGITICPEWLGKRGFEKFLSDMGERPLNTVLDRRDNDGPYCNENCRWVTPKQSVRNREVTTMLTVDGVTKPLAEWAEESGVHWHTLQQRIHRGWDHKEAVFGKLVRWTDQEMSNLETWYREGVSVSEIAKRLGKKTNTVHVKLSKERRKRPDLFQIRVT